MKLKKPENYQEFCQSLTELLNDTEFPTENVSTRGFIEAMSAWLKDTSGGEHFFTCNEYAKSICWEDLLTLIRASAIYE